MLRAGCAPAGGGRRVRPRRGPRGRAGSTLGSPPRVAGTTSEDLRSEGYTDRGRGTYSPRPRRATSRLSFCARPKRLSSARKPPSSLRPSSVGASSSAWRRTRSPLPGWPQPPAAARRSAEPRASPKRRSRASCRRRSTPGSPPVSARSHLGAALLRRRLFHLFMGVFARGALERRRGSRAHAQHGPAVWPLPPGAVGDSTDGARS